MVLAIFGAFHHKVKFVSCFLFYLLSTKKFKIALANGGGAFLIPYLVVLIVLGKPVYYLEMLIGQFSSRGTIKVFDLCPAMRGLGYSQTIACAVVSTFYAAIVGVTFLYFFASFSDTLPWTECAPEWSSENVSCISATKMAQVYENATGVIGSASAYFSNVVFHVADNLDNGIGYPDRKLAVCVILSWTLIIIILAKGVHSSGKISYFLAIFPYIVMFILLIRAITLPGAINGIKYFFTPQWDKLLDGKVSKIELFLFKISKYLLLRSGTLPLHKYFFRLPFVLETS